MDPMGNCKMPLLNKFCLRGFHQTKFIQIGSAKSNLLLFDDNGQLLCLILPR